MSSQTRGLAQRRVRWFKWIRDIVIVGVILTEIGGAYILFRSVDVSDPVVYGGTVATAIIIGGSALYVGSRQVFRSGSPSEPSEKSDLARVSEVVVSITVLTAVTVLLGSLGWIALTVLAMIGGPDPKTNTGELLRSRLVRWPQRNRDFMRNNGKGTLPLKP